MGSITRNILRKWNQVRGQDLLNRRFLSFSSITQARKVKEVVSGNTISIEGEDLKPDTSKNSLRNVHNPAGSCPLCRLNVDVKYDDLLILRQFMRSDGTVLPRQLTGLCPKQQTKVERCVMQAHWSGLFPKFNSKNEPISADRSEYRQFNRYWENDWEMYQRKHKTVGGSFFYIRRYKYGLEK